MKVSPAASVALPVAAIAAMLSGCASHTNTASTGSPGALMSAQQKQQAVENSNMSPEAKQAWEQAAARAAASPPPILKKTQ